MSGNEINNYLKLARFDHATKHIFILPGIILAFIISGNDIEPLVIIIGIISAIFTASANYTINE